MAKGCGDARFLLPGSGGPGRLEPFFFPRSYRLYASPSSLPRNNNRQRAVADFPPLLRGREVCPRQSTTAPRSNGVDTVMLSLSAFIVYTHRHNYVKGFPPPNLNYWDNYGSGQLLAIAFILKPTPLILSLSKDGSTGSP